MKTALPPWVRLVREPTKAPSRADLAAIQGPADVVGLLGSTFEASEVEMFVVIALDRQNKPIHRHVVTTGLVDASLVHPREVFRTALAVGASAIIVAHNHPSENPTPSREDREVTRQLVAAGKVLDVPVLDHIIYGTAKRFISLGSLNGGME